MVRYIKDGAYTIVVDDVGVDETNAEGGAAAPAGEEGAVGADGKPVPPRSRGEARIKTKRELEDELYKIDYTNPEFILQNLSLATPKYEDDTTFTLSGRNEVADIIAQQICFYVYCLLQVHTHRTTLPTILLFGDGFIGCRVISLLTEQGCQPLLRIYCRGEYGMNEWKNRGYQSSCNLLKLMTNQKADIIIICSEYSSFQLIYHMVKDCELISDTTGIITSTLGFQRKKLYYNFGVPTVFRTYVEPQKIVRNIGLAEKDKLQKLENEIALSGFDNPSSIPEGGGGSEEDRKSHTTLSLKYRIEQILAEEKRREEEEMILGSGILNPVGGLAVPTPGGGVVGGGSGTNTASNNSITNSNSKPASLKENSSNPSNNNNTNNNNNTSNNKSSGKIGKPVVVFDMSNPEQNNNNNTASEDDENDNDNSSIDTGSITNESLANINEGNLPISEKAAFYMLQRTPDLKNIVFLLENYYAVNEIPPEDSRFLALRSIFGYVDSTKRDIQIIPTSELKKQQANRNRKMFEDPFAVKHIERIILSMFAAVVKGFHHIFSKALPMNDMILLTDRQMLVRQLSHFDHLLAAANNNNNNSNGNMMNQTGNSSPSLLSPERPSTSDSNLGHGPPLATNATDDLLLKDSFQSRSNMYHATSQLARPHDHYVDSKGKHHLLEKMKMSKLKYLRMHDYETISNILESDDDYSNCTGPGFEFMKVLDSRESRKITMNNLLNQQDVGYLYKQVLAPGDDGSNPNPHDAVNTIPTNAIPMNIRASFNPNNNGGVLQPDSLASPSMGIDSRTVSMSVDEGDPSNNDPTKTPETKLNSRKNRYEKFKQNLKSFNNNPANTNQSTPLTALQNPATATPNPNPNPNPNTSSAANTPPPSGEKVPAGNVKK
jgi:hypothetical protein